MTAAAYNQTCPMCSAQVPVYPGFPTWCECGWEKDLTRYPPQKGFVPRLWKWLGLRWGERLHQKAVLQAAGLLRNQTRISINLLLAYFFATIVHIITICVLVSAALMVLSAIRLWYSEFLVITLARLFGAGLLGVFYLKILPKFPHSSTSAMSRDNFPVLFRAIDKIAAAGQMKTIDYVIPTWEFTIGHSRVGWRQHSAIVLGLPCLSALDGPALAAVLAHELAHRANQDVLHSFWIGSAIQTLSQWIDLFAPIGRRLFSGEAVPWLALLFLIPIWLFSVTVTAIAYLLSFLLSLLLYSHSQWTEYHADAVSARITGSCAGISALRKMGLGEVYIRLLNQAAQFPETDIWSSWKRLMADIPGRSFVRIDRMISKGESRIDETHPSPHHRMSFLRSLPLAEVKTSISSDEMAQIRAELCVCELRADQAFRQLIRTRRIAW